MSQVLGAVAPRKEVTGLKRMTPKGLRDLCKKDKLYQTPRLNDVLYLHYQGYQYIESLEEYTELKCLWLECNAISEIEGLTQQSKLKCLFLQNNLIKKIENLGPCAALDTLNLSFNHIRKIENIGSDILPVLNTLNISSNYLKDSESIAQLAECKNLSVVDLSNNRIDDILVVKIFEQMPCLKVLVLQGNPVVSRLPQYRKTLILACKELTYLDSRPVFPRDRSCAEAWKKGGYEAERKENQRWNRAERKKMRDSVNYTIKLRNKHLAEDKQESLLTSTDSEAENEVDMRSEQNRLKSAIEYGCVDDMWNEVSGSEAKSASSDEENTRPIVEQSSKHRLAPLDGRPKVLHESQYDDMDEAAKQQLVEEIITEVADVGAADNIESINIDKESKIETIKQPEGKRLVIEEGSFNDVKEQSELPEANIHDEINALIDKTVSELPVLQIEAKNKQMDCPDLDESDTISEDPTLVNSEPSIGLENDSEIGSGSDLEQSCQALGAVAQSYEEKTNEDLVRQSIDKMYNDFGTEMYAEHAKPLGALLDEGTTDFELKLDLSSADYPPLIDNEECATERTKRNTTDNAVNIAEANARAANDFEYLSSNLDKTLEAVRQPIEQLHAEPNKDSDDSDTAALDDKECIELITTVRSRRIIEEFTVRRERISDSSTKSKEENVNENETSAAQSIDKELKLEHIVTKVAEAEYNFAKILDEATDNVPKRVFGAGYDKPSHDWLNEERWRQLKVKDMFDDLTEDEYENIVPLRERELTSAEQAHEICEQMNKKLAEDETDLRNLLQQLENENEALYAICDNLEAEDLEPLPEPDTADVCQSVLNGIIDELQYQEVINAQNIKSFDFGLIESDEEYSYSANPKVERIVPAELEDPAGGKTLRECLDTFGDFYGSLSEREYQSGKQRKLSTSSEKVTAAKQLLKSKMLAELNEDNVDAQLAKHEKKTKRRAAAIATRCYEKREQYEDTLEVVDGRLVIVKKSTGDIEDLPPPPELISDSELSSSSSSSSSSAEDDDYETAEEESQHVLESDGLHVSRLTTTRAQGPKSELPESEVFHSMNLCITEDAVEEETDAEPESESTNEFFSLEAKSTFDSLDTQFLEMLDLQKVIGNDGEITTDGMRNYNELTKDDAEQSVVQSLEADEVIINLVERQHAQEEREQKLQEAKEAQELPVNKYKLVESDIFGDIDENKTNHLSIEAAAVEAETIEINASTVENQCNVLENEDIEQKLPNEQLNAEENIEIKENVQAIESDDLGAAAALGPIKLTLGSCTIYERESQVANENIEANQTKTTEAKIELSSLNAANETEQQIEKSKCTTSVKLVSETENLATQQQNAANDKVDDDILSDDYTDYESDESIAVVEPPKLPAGELIELCANQFEESSKVDRECDEVLRKALFNLPIKQQNFEIKKMDEDETENQDLQTVENSQDETKVKCKICEITDINNQSTEVGEQIVKVMDENDEDDATDAFGELQMNAKQQWDKLSKRLHEFISADDMKLLEKQEFKESENEADDDDEEEAELMKDLSDLQAVNVALDGNIDIKAAGDSTMIETDAENIENKDKDMEAKSPSNDNQTAKPTIRLDYFEDPNVDVDAADFGVDSVLKTEEIECNLEILNEDDDTVVKNVSVSAQVKYEFK
ncbi:dtr [Drosophila busckii]|uniref:Dynein axonemal assembly factor 1 homolog n=1 Tax=Drosophila busckii TaxID=30019 RepID=A0A0M3QTP1_DROBS|nr:dynein assembly factor 1, axonemal homolog [Drosophila busckii]ALC39253.1 dtr [Drosophila busckii]